MKLEGGCEAKIILAIEVQDVETERKWEREKRSRKTNRERERDIKREKIERERDIKREKIERENEI